MWIHYLLAALSGVAYIVACAPLDQYYLMWFAFIPLLYALETLPAAKNTAWMRFRLALTTSIFMAITGYYWLIYATEHYGGLPWIAAFIVFVAFAFTSQLQVPVYVFLRNYLRGSSLFKNRTVLTAFILGGLYVALDTAIPKLFSDTIGSAFYNASWVRQLADLGGPMVITFVGMAVNELLFSALFKRDAKKVVLPVAIGIVICLYGAYRVRELSELRAAHANDPVFRASVAQGNIGDFTKVAAERGEKSAVSQVIGEYVSLSEQAMKSVPPPDAVIWPETAYPAIFERPFTQNEIQMEQMVRSLISHYPGYLIFGGYDNDVRGLDYNSVFFVKSLPSTSEPTPDAVEKQVYHKSTLLMFGETLPFADEFPAMKNWFPTMGFFGSGPGPEVVSIKNGAGEVFKFAPSICYEGLFVDFSALGALQGADALLNVTNDSWFGEHGEPYQHLSLTRFRSIETRLPMIRATNTGFSVWIDPLGEQVKSTELFKAELLDIQIQHRFFPESPYLVLSRMLGPNWLIRFFQTLSFALIAAVWFTNKRSPSR